MEPLHILETEESPMVHFDKTKGIFRLCGKSYMEDVQTFYNPVLAWLQNYAQTPSDTMVVFVKMEYINTASSKMILDLFECINTIYKKNGNPTVVWQYMEDDEDIEDQGNEFKDMFEYGFKLEPVPSD